MIIIHLARKPLSKCSIVASVLDQGAGGLNIDGCRISTEDITGRHVYESKGWKNASGMTGSVSNDWMNGRWPANLILEHLPECQQVGTKKVKGMKAKPGGSPRFTDDVYNPTSATHVRTPYPGHADADGTETITAYECAPGCPVAELDEQSIAGGSHPGGRKTGFHKREGISKTYGGNSLLNSSTEHLGSREYGDTGGASRFFKQVGGHPK